MSVEHEWPKRRDGNPDRELLEQRQDSKGLCRYKSRGNQPEGEPEAYVDGAEALARLSVEHFVAGRAANIHLKRRLKEPAVAAARAPKFESAQENVNQCP